MRARLLAALGVLVGLGALAYGGWVWDYAVTFVWTDDAYVEGTISPVSAKGGGPRLRPRARPHPGRGAGRPAAPRGPPGLPGKGGAGPRRRGDGRGEPPRGACRRAADARHHAGADRAGARGRRGW